MKRALLLPALLLPVLAACADGDPPGGTGGSGGTGGTPATCGDGIVNNDEVCDDNGESASCNADCTTAECGDGTLNETAGETCDDAGESAACNEDCSAAACGDAIINAMAGETCDDQNATAGDGCSAVCAIEGTCSDPVLLPLQNDANGIQRASVSAATSAAGSVEAATCNVTVAGDAADRVYTFHLAEPSNVTLTAVASGWDMVMRVLADPCDVASEVDCSNIGDVGATEMLQLQALPAGQHFVVIDGVTAEDEGAFTFDIEARQLVPSCNAARVLFPGLPSGTFTLDPDGDGGPGEPFDAYCDLESDGGGWTLIARFSNADATNWMLDTGEWWYQRTDPAGDPTSRDENADMISPAFWQMDASEIKLTRSDGLNDGAAVYTTGNCMGGRSFRSFITSFGDFQNAAVWADDSVAHTCAVMIGDPTNTSGFDQLSCSGNIGGPGTISFWADWNQSGGGDGSVIMIGGGGNACQRADHGIGVTEGDAASFGDMFEADFGDDGILGGDDFYALNLFVR